MYIISLVDVVKINKKVKKWLTFIISCVQFAKKDVFWLMKIHAGTALQKINQNTPKLSRTFSKYVMSLNVKQNVRLLLSDTKSTRSKRNVCSRSRILSLIITLISKTVRDLEIVRISDGKFESSAVL